MFSTLDLEKFPSEFVADTTAKERLIKVEVDCLNDVLSYSLDKMKSLKMERKASKTISVGGIGAIKTVLEVLSVSSDLLKTYLDLPCKLSSHCILNVEDFVYCFGGNVDGSFFYFTNKV